MELPKELIDEIISLIKDTVYEYDGYDDDGAIVVEDFVYFDPSLYANLVKDLPRTHWRDMNTQERNRISDLRSAAYLQSIEAGEKHLVTSIIGALRNSPFFWMQTSEE